MTSCKENLDNAQELQKRAHDIGQKLSRKRKRYQAGSPRVQGAPAEIGARISLKSCAVEDKEAASGTDSNKNHPINHWIQEGDQPRKYIDENEMSHLFAKKRSSSVGHK